MTETNEKCECSICRGETPDSPISYGFRCSICEAPITYAATHRGETRCMARTGVDGHPDYIHGEWVHVAYQARLVASAMARTEKAGA